MKDIFVNDWGDDIEGQSGFLIKNNINMKWHLHLYDETNEIYGVLGLYDEDGKNGVHFDLEEDLSLDWRKDDGDNVYNKFKNIIKHKNLKSENLQDLFLEIKEHMKAPLDLQQKEVNPFDYKYKYFFIGPDEYELFDNPQEEENLFYNRVSDSIKKGAEELIKNGYDEEKAEKTARRKLAVLMEKELNPKFEHPLLEERLNAFEDILKRHKTTDVTIHQDIKHETENTIEKVKNTVDMANIAGHVQGVCECVAILGDNHDLAKKMLNEMNITRDMAQKYAKPETFKALEQGIFAQNQEQCLEQTQGIKR